MTFAEIAYKCKLKGYHVYKLDAGTYNIYNPAEGKSKNVTESELIEILGA